ncbi:MAG: type II toxin-antitoxin system RelE/ParE family toxin [Elusimicrobia bacterium HGW-Elusimicrobia-1]|jgi:mRNA interferase RelE/StbE|nr:MAG: type II toxin-antitoxin system RelE/ParE family toxin [Elusimicrobia bacterium HGW-Elusimicrobia-1]
MDLYKVEVKKSAVKELQSLDTRFIPVIWKQIKKLSENPTPMHSAKLWASDKSYRIRIGNYRVVYQVDDDRRIVTVQRIKHRREVYR